MAPSVCQNPPRSEVIPQPKIMTSEAIWTPNFITRENQRPPVYNPEDYVLSLKKFGKRQNDNVTLIYDNNEIDKSPEKCRSATLPTKYSEFKNSFPSTPENCCEMSLRQFESVTDLLTKLRSDLRASFPSFVQEFVSTPSDGVSLLLEVLRAIQLSQTINSNLTNTTSSMPRNTQSYQRRTLLDELACLQCLSICCSRSPEARARLATTSVGLLPLAASAIGQGIRSRIFALQLLTAACEKSSIGHGIQKNFTAGHSAVSEAISTLRLRCGEPVRFRLLVGMLNSGGGSGELQAFGIKFLNTFLNSTENVQNRLYLQTELYQAGFDTNSMTKSISSTSPWLEKLRAEIRHFEENKIDVEKLQVQAQESYRIKNQMIILERRVQILQEEKGVLTSMERRLQERCAELQREIFRLQGAHIENNYNTMEKSPIALPRHIPSENKQISSEHEDEGISSSETGPSLSPVPILVLPQNKMKNFNVILTNGENYNHKDDNGTINDVTEEINNIVNDDKCEKSYDHLTPPIKISGSDKLNKFDYVTKEKDIVPVNLLPQPPRKSRSLAHIMSLGGSEGDPSEYGIQNNNKTIFLDDLSFNNQNACIENEISDLYQAHPSTNRDILDVIMNAREEKYDPTMNALQACSMDQIPRRTSLLGAPTSPQQLNGVFFMTDINAQQRYHTPDITVALQSKRVSKTLDCIESCGIDSMIDIRYITTGSKSANNQEIFFGNNLNSNFKITTNNRTYSRNATIIHNDPSVRTRSHTESKVTDVPSGLY